MQRVSEQTTPLKRNYGAWMGHSPEGTVDNWCKGCYLSLIRALYEWRIPLDEIYRSSNFNRCV